jgi:5-carboxymethyl-2-hydroxymuconate isomerase
MPHVVIEYSKPIAETVDIEAIIHLLHHRMIDSGLFNAPDIKTRAYAADYFSVGTMGQDGSFVHVNVSILHGRTLEQRETLVNALLDSIREPLHLVDQVTINIHEMARETYRKSIRNS